MLLNFKQKILFEKAIHLHKQGEFKRAIKLYSQLIKKNKNNLHLLFMMGTANVQGGENISGIKYLSKLLDLEPNNAPALINIGNAFKNLKRYEEAIINYNKAIDKNPNSADAFSNRGIAFQNLNRFDEAILSFNKAIEINPNNFFAHNNRGVVFKRLDRFDEAISSFNKAIELNPNYVEAYNNRGTVYKILKIYDKSLPDYEKVLKLNQNYDYILGKVLLNKMFLCDWENFDLMVKKIDSDLKKGFKVIDPFSYLGLADDASSARLASEIFVKNRFPEISKIRPFTKHVNKKLKIAYFSGEFHNHPILHLMMDVFKNHDKSKFDIYGFSMGPDKNDKWRNKVKKYFYQFKDVNKISDTDVVNLARSLQIDIAIDLSGYTGNNNISIFSNRVAPIQINYLGYPGTSSLTNMDYIIADETIIPKENFKYYSEKVLHLPHCYQANMNQREISDKDLSRSDFGLPKNGFIYCCFNNNYKITPHVFDIWMKILQEVKHSVLWILKTNDIALENLKKEAQKRGVNPNRIVFASQLSNEEHLKRIKLADLFLDTFPYNAHTTASDAIRMGIPIVTLAGKSFASRVAASLLKNINMEELVAHNLKDYEKLAIDLGTNYEKFKKIKSLFKDNVPNSTLFDSLKFTKDLENIYLKLL